MIYPDRIWEQIEPYLPGRKGSKGREAKDNGLFINAVFWIFRTGAPWRDLPLLIMETGRTLIEDFVAGEIEMFGIN